MADAPPFDTHTATDGGRLVETLLLFARTLRAAGLPVGPGRVLTAIRAMQVVGITRRDDLYWALHAVFVTRHDQTALFDQAFHLFWRNPQLLARLMRLFLPEGMAPPRPGDPAQALSRRLVDALRADQARTQQPRDAQPPEERFDAVMTWSESEVLRMRDFEAMSAAELAQAKTAIAALRLQIMAVPTRRFRTDAGGRRADPRASLRTALRTGSDVIPIRWRRRQTRHPPLVTLCDISGSMSRYSRMLLHFMHAIINDRDRVHSFLFGTRLTNITRDLRHKDVDVAIENVAKHVVDWDGGTRIGACLHDFNIHWSRRVLGQGAVVLLISDGLDRDNAEGLRKEMERLHKSCRRLIWLNPLLRFEGFTPKSHGAQAMMPHVDEFRPVHNLESLTQLTAVLSRTVTRRQEAATEW